MRPSQINYTPREQSPNAGPQKLFTATPSTFRPPWRPANSDFLPTLKGENRLRLPPHRYVQSLFSGASIPLPVEGVSSLRLSTHFGTQLSSLPHVSAKSISLTRNVACFHCSSRSFAGRWSPQLWLPPLSNNGGILAMASCPLR